MPDPSSRTYYIEPAYDRAALADLRADAETEASWFEAAAVYRDASGELVYAACDKPRATVETLPPPYAL